MANVTQGGFNLFFTKTQDQLQKFLEKEIVYDEVVDSWMFMGSVWPVSSILIVYLLFILKVGPNMMESRKPLNLKYVLLLYNIAQTLFNAWIVSLLFLTPGALTYQLSHFCHPMPRHMNQFLVHSLNSGSWYFFISKVFDLMDTVFFVLRKKQSQITFLHIYHHVNMVFTTWAFLRFIKGEQLVFGAILNSFVHVLMYAYYFLSALGPQVQKYLWWKKYLTRLQISQFIFIMGYNLALFCLSCDIPRLFILYIIADTALFLYLFCVFYARAYKKMSEQKTKKT